MRHIMRSACVVLFILAVAAFGFAGGSGESSEPTDGGEQTESGQTRTIEHYGGRVTEVPVNPRRVVTVRDQHGIFPLWQLGFRNIVGSAGSIDENGEPYFRRMEAHGFDPSGVEWVGRYGEPDLEAIAALNPDLIIGARTDEEIYDQLSSIAPTVLMDPWRDAPLREIMMDYAEVFGLEEAVDRLESQYEENLARLREAAGDPSEIVISLISTAASGGTEVGQFYAIGTASHTVEAVLREVGFARPAPQLAVDTRTYYSVERIREHDADLLLRMTSRQGADEEMENTRAVKGSPLWDQLNAVQKGQAYDVNGEATVGGGYAPYITFTETLMGLLEGLDTSGDLSHVEIAIPDGD